MRTLTSILLAALVFSAAVSAQAEVKRKKFTAGSAYLIVEVLGDDLIHCEVSAADSGPTDSSPIYASPMVFKTDYSGPSLYRDHGNSLETADFQIEVDSSSLQVTFLDKRRGNALLAEISARGLAHAEKELRINSPSVEHVYGLGQRFKVEGSADGDWLALGLRDGSEFGNGFVGFAGAAVGNVQIPVMYAASENANYALMFDNVYKQDWDFREQPWKVKAYGDQLRYYVMAGPNLLDLRKDFMELTGRPPVPPRKAFGLWVSEFGYDNWDQVDELKAGLRREKFPVDGFVLDLNWFGGINTADHSKGHMGRLDWDVTNDSQNSYYFPDPKQRIAAYQQDHVGITVIEEAYLANTSKTYAEMPAELSSYERLPDGSSDPAQRSAIIDVKGFWGKGRMVDWTDPVAGKYIHDQRRFPNLAMNGVTSHWTDLGEPENFNPYACYDGVETTAAGRKTKHADIHNIYNLLWNKSIWDGYFEHRDDPSAFGKKSPRPFILARSGSAGSQRYGVAMWSGDIASNLKSLATHANAQMHMAFSGIDYYGADVGGFRREKLPHNNRAGAYRKYEGETYTQWFANSCWFDVPVRPHVDNEFVEANPEYETAPHLVGHKPSNLANLRQRYELIPYYYSLAYRAYLFGEPAFPPLVMHYQNDPQVRGLAHEKLIGRDLLVGVVARYGEYERDMYLPSGKWANYHTHEWVVSQGETLRALPVYRDGVFRLPAFARAGSIIPMMHVDEQTKDAFGARTDGVDSRQTMIVQVYADPVASEFTLYEDDGVLLQYESNGRPKYRHRETEIKQRLLDENTASVRIEPAVAVNGADESDGLATSRHEIVRLVVDGMRGVSVIANGETLPEQPSASALDGAESGWCNAGRNLIIAKSPQQAVSVAKDFVFKLSPIPPVTSVNFVCDNGVTSPGVSIYVVGDLPELGNFDPAKAIKLDPNVYHDYIVHPPEHGSAEGPSTPKWSCVVSALPPNKMFRWKFIRKRDDGTGDVEFEPGDNHVHSTGPSGYSGRLYGSF